MKITAVIQRLRELKEQEGDLEVGYLDDIDDGFASVGGLLIVERGWDVWGDQDREELGARFVGMVSEELSKDGDSFKKRKIE